MKDLGVSLTSASLAGPRSCIADPPGLWSPRPKVLSLTRPREGTSFHVHILYSRLPDPLPTVERSPDDSSLGSGLPPEPRKGGRIDRNPRCSQRLGEDEVCG